MASHGATDSFLARAYKVKDPEACRALYDEWAASYEKDVLDPTQDYVAPTLVAQALVRATGQADLSGRTIYDAGCGTGLVGIALRQCGAAAIDGTDLSEGMLAAAKRTGAYRSLAPVDLSQPLTTCADASYDVVTCVGTFTQAHVGPVPALAEFVRILQPHGLIAATVLDEIYESGGYKTEIDRLVAEGRVSLVGNEAADYRKGADVKARIVILKKL